MTLKKVCYCAHDFTPPDNAGVRCCVRCGQQEEFPGDLKPIYEYKHPRQPFYDPDKRPLCRFKGCASRTLITLDPVLAARRGHLCIDHAAQADKLEGGAGLKVNPRPTTCSVGMDWE